MDNIKGNTKAGDCHTLVSKNDFYKLLESFMETELLKWISTVFNSLNRF